jgi:hypothetical protein
MFAQHKTRCEVSKIGLREEDSASVAAGGVGVVHDEVTGVEPVSLGG